MGFVKHPITPQASVIGDPAANRQRGKEDPTRSRDNRRIYSASTPRVKQAAGERLLFDQSANDEAAEGGVWFGIGRWVAVGFLAIVSKFYFPLGTEGWIF